MQPITASSAAAPLQTLSLRWVRIALVYFLSAVLLGVAMAASHDHRLKGVHVHLNMLGWVSMSLFAWLYHQFPRAAQSKGALVHFWLYNTMLPLMMVALGGLLLGDARFEPVIAVGSIAVLASVVVFVVTMLRATFAPKQSGVAMPQPAAS
jgi:hypothetical protein